MVTAAKDRLTGPGKKEKLPDGSTLLFNFDIDSSDLKKEHRDFLENTIVKAANNSPNGLRVVVGGSADRLGDAGHNVALSNRRIDAVIAFLKRRKPGYRWTFVGFGQGVGETTAERAGDRDNTRDDLFRSVIVEVLAPGQPVPPKPSIPKSFPKKPNVFPRALPVPKPTTCLTEQECPISQNFTIQLLVAVTGGEIIEGAFLTFLMKDLLNKVEALYSLTGGGLGTPGLPANVSLIGSPAQFRPSKATKVTNFGPVGGISSLTVPVGPGGSVPITIFSVMNFTFHDSGSIIPAGNVFIDALDTGPVSIPGAGIHGGRFKLESICRGERGADRS
jgi:hypothetical protein